MCSTDSSAADSFAVIIAAAGNSSRFTVRSGRGTVFSEEKKTFVFLRGKSVWQYSVEKFAVRSDVKQVIITLSPEDIGWFRRNFSEEIERFSLEIAEGGEERKDSVQNGLNKVLPDIDYVAVHDAARPCVSDSQIEDVFSEAVKTGAAVLASPLTGTIKRAENYTITETVSRTGLWEAQTPQVFRKSILAEAFRKQGTLAATDEAQLLENIAYPVSIVPAHRWNLKITEQRDLLLAEKILEAAAEQ